MLSYIKNTNFRIPFTTYSPESNILLDRIFDKMAEGGTAWLENNNIDLVPIPLEEAIGGHYYSNILEEIREEIEKTMKEFYKASFYIRNRHIEIFFLSAKRSRFLQSMRTYLHKIYIWLYMACSFANDSLCSQSLKIYIYMSVKKKVFPQKGRVLGTPHVNAGFTYSCIPSNEIHVYREEEWFKVVIHETFHSLHLDFSSMDEKIANTLMYDLIPIKIDFRFYEAYTDIWADIIHTAFIAKGSITRFNKLINIERKFSIYQCSRVLYHYGLSYMDLFDPIRNTSYNESSYVISYYIAKSCFHYFMDDFLKWCAISNRGSIQFRHIENNIRSFCKLYENLYHNPSYIACLDRIEKILYKGVPKVLGNTLRRTILES